MNGAQGQTKSPGVILDRCKLTQRVEPTMGGTIELPTRGFSVRQTWRKNPPFTHR